MPAACLLNTRCQAILCMKLVKYGSEEKGSSLCRCSILLSFIMSKNKRGCVLNFYLRFFDIIKPRRIEHLQKEEPFSSDPYFSTYMFLTPSRTHSISGLKSRVLKLTFFSLKMMVKSGLEFILKLTEPLQRYLLTCQANSALLGRFFCTGQQQL